MEHIEYMKLKHQKDIHYHLKKAMQELIYMNGYIVENRQYQKKMMQKQ